MAYDGTLIHNIMKHTVLIQPYRADGIAVETSSPEIGPGEWRLINNDHIGDADQFFVLAFMKDSEVPKKIGVPSESYEQSGSVGLSGEFAGFGGGIEIAGSNSGVTYFSASMAAAIVKLTHNPATGRFESNEKFLLEAQDGTVSFNPGAMNEQLKDRAKMVVWGLLYAPDQASRPDDDKLKGW